MNDSVEHLHLHHRISIEQKCEFLASDEKDRTEYFNEYSLHNGLIASVASHKEAGESVFWSDATFAVWKFATAYFKTNIQDIRYIGQAGIDNPFTVSIINRVVPDRYKKVSIFNYDTDEFRALLGTPNGVGGVYLLMEHKKILLRKTIPRILVFRDTYGDDPKNDQLFLIYEVWNMPNPWEIQVPINGSDVLGRPPLTLPLGGNGTGCLALLNSSIAELNSDS